MHVTCEMVYVTDTDAGALRVHSAWIIRPGCRPVAATAAAAAATNVLLSSSSSLSLSSAKLCLPVNTVLAVYTRLEMCQAKTLIIFSQTLKNFYNRSQDVVDICLEMF